eukprot:CAMPEP_0195296270 /NCGR_PEP_ID=MMETSP0707-20130614/19101_1 /TAXON_ID=33640 /ORGANISM="Asterionellopsis glacialis, Strain CCMP134" /LENGTH=47 /DNA_ID= /DNA_START= /DNA_END= /DNA_ORIENTATION=
MSRYTSDGRMYNGPSTIVTSIIVDWTTSGRSQLDSTDRHETFDHVIG